MFSGAYHLPPNLGLHRLGIYGLWMEHIKRKSRTITNKKVQEVKKKDGQNAKH